MNELTGIINILNDLIFPISKKDYDKNSIQKNIYKLLRCCLQEKIYEVRIGSYIINLDPKELSIVYETEITKVKVSNRDVYFETERPTEIRYFVLTNNKQEAYSLDIPYVMVTGNILNINEAMEAHYEFNLVNSDSSTKLIDYLSIPANYETVVYKDNNITNIVLATNITKEEERPNIYDLFVKEKVRPVLYKENDAFLDDESFNNETYSRYLPNLENEKEITSYLYNTIVEFYTEYMK